MKTELPVILESKLADFRRRVWIVKLTEGVLAGVVGVYLSWLLLFGLDRVMDTPAWVRWVLMVGGTSVLALGLPLKWHRWVWRQQRLEDAARLLRHTFPRLGDQLLGIVELAHVEAGSAGRSERLVQAAMAQAAEAVKDKDLRSGMPTSVLTRWTWATTLLIAIFATAFFGVNEAALNTMGRWLMPWKNIERYTFAQIQQLPDRLVVPYAEPFDLNVQLHQNTRWSPATAKARISDQPVVVSSLQAGAYPLEFPPQKEDAALSLSLGDVRKTLSVVPRTRPELTALSIRTRLPEYLKYQTEPRIEVRGGAVSVLKGAQASLEATASRELASAEVDGEAEKVSGAQVTTPFHAIDASAEKHVMWKDRDGLTPREPLVLKITAIQDEAPRLAARRETQEQVVLDSEVVVFDVDVQDDFGIQRMGLSWHSVNDDKTQGDKIAAAGEPEKKTLASKATFCANRDGVEPQTLEIRAWAEDYLPNRKRAYSTAFLLHVLNKTDHALWLTEQFGKWLEAARESYEREQQLHATNQELRALAPADLDRPENRRKIAQQASAENANSARLGMLNQSGRSLVEQATRNDEFDAKRLESWATMLKSLQDISAKRMPSVADLLKQSANAQNGKSAQSTAGNPPSNSSQQSSKAGKPSEGKAGQTKPSAPQIANGPDLPKASQGSKASSEEQKKDNMPSITDREGSMSTPEQKPADPNAKPSPPKPSAMKLPTTQMAAAPSKGKDDKAAEKPPEQPATPAQKKMEDAINEQELLLAEFARVSDELGSILASLEASTFVKRLKAASRQQLVTATDLNTKTLSAFGLERKPVQNAAAIAENEKKQSETVRVIQSDLEAYFARKPDMHFKNIIGQMKQTQVVKMLTYLGDQAAVNLSGNSMAGAEFWADTLDRWAEEMVAASECKSCSSCSADSLPPEIVLQVMKALRDEMKLRDETRELESSKTALKEGEHGKKSAALASKQFGIQASTRGAFDDILRLPQGNEKFGKELKLLDSVMHVMDEAAGILDKPDTGAPAVAAETEAIELLLQAKRQGKGGGGGGGSPGGGSGSDADGEAALADLGPGADADTNVNARPVGQATGKAGRELPEEFKTGLDAYFNKLEAGGGKKE